MKLFNEYERKWVRNVQIISPKRFISKGSVNTKDHRIISDITNKYCIQENNMMKKEKKKNRMANTAVQIPTYITPIIWNSKLFIYYITNLGIFHIQ
jgi:hypothetical protein